MLKKLFKLGMLACAMFACSSFAQNERMYAPEYPDYGFWSNWSIGGELIYDWQIDNGGIADWRTGTNAGLGLIVEKDIDHILALRLHMATPGLWKPIIDATTGEFFDRYGRVTLDFKFSINNAIKGYNLDRKGSIYVYFGPGMTYNIGTDQYGRIGMVMDGGLGYSYKCCDHGTIFAEIGGDMVGDYRNIFKGNWENSNVWAALGWMYNFGPTATDLEMIAQKALLTQENFDNLNNQIAALEQEVANSKKAEQKLENKINDLENQMANFGGNNARKYGNSAEADSLQQIINNMKADQLNFYAMPFSILYDVDQYQIPEDQEEKIKAVARVMKDNENVKFAIVGFCDHTGSDAYNMKLSQKRAETVKKVLVNKYGIAEDRLSCDWKGKNNPFGDVKMGINRRVSFYRVIE